MVLALTSFACAAWLRHALILPERLDGCGGALNV